MLPAAAPTTATVVPSTSSSASTEEKTVRVTEALNLTVSRSAGRLRRFSKAWSDLTSNVTLLEWVKGYKIPFVTPPVQLVRPVSRLSKSDIDLLSPEVESLI